MNNSSPSNILAHKKFLVLNFFAKRNEGDRIARLRKLEGNVEKNHYESNVRLNRTTLNMKISPSEGSKGDQH